MTATFPLANEAEVQAFDQARRIFDATERATARLLVIEALVARGLLPPDTLNEELADVEPPLRHQPPPKQRPTPTPARHPPSRSGRSR